MPKSALAATIATADQTFSNLWHAVMNIVDWIVVGVLVFGGGCLECSATGPKPWTVLGSWTLSDFEKNNPNFKLGEDFGIAPLPMAKQHVVPNGGWALGISSKAQFPKEAWEFIKYVSSFVGIKKYVKETGDIPARSSVSMDLPEFNQYPKNIFFQQV